MSLLQIFIGDIRPLPESGRPTGIYKQPLTAPMALGTEGFAGDHQADRRVHGGPQKAVHFYPAVHYARLAARFPEAAARLVPGSLGENLSSDAFDEENVRIGECFALGTARLQVCQPRNPCWKIDERFGCDGMAEFIAREGLNGWYFSVVESGQAGPGDVLQRLPGDYRGPTLADALRLCRTHRPPLAALVALTETPGIAAQWRDKLCQRLAWLRQHDDEAVPQPFHVKPADQ